MRILLIAPHKKARILLRFLRERCLYTVTTVGSLDAAKRFLGQDEEVVIFTPEVVSDILREFALLKNTTLGKSLYVTEWDNDGYIWPLLLLGLDGYTIQCPEKIDQALKELRDGKLVFVS